jgi:sec-independent protein translocase protein TatA
MFENIFQPTHLILVLGIALLFFGPKKLPELGRGLGESIRGFRNAMQQKHDEPKDEPKGT